MTQGRWIDVETAGRVLKNACSFLERDDVADFRITDGREAVYLSMYSPAFYLLDGDYRFRFKPILDGDGTREPLCVVSLSSEMISTPEIPIFGIPVLYYLSFFPQLLESKRLFLINRSYYERRQNRALSYILDDVFERIAKAGLSPTDCLVWISNSKGEFGEEFWDYIAGIILREKGYFVTRYAGAQQGHGQAAIYGWGDLSAYYIPDFLDALMERGFLSRGAFIEELEMLKKRSRRGRPPKLEYESAIVESESSDAAVRLHSRGAGVGQIIHKYLSYESGYRCGFVSGPFVKNYREIHCQDEKCRCKAIGLISCDENGNIIYLPPKTHQLYPPLKIESIKSVIKSSLLRNLSFKERCRLIGTSPADLKDYFEKILSLPVDVILDEIEKKLKY